MWRASAIIELYHGNRPEQSGKTGKKREEVAASADSRSYTPMRNSSLALAIALLGWASPLALAEAVPDEINAAEAGLNIGHPWRPPFGLERIGQPRETGVGDSQGPTLEVDAVASPDTVINPVDLGTILVPANWLLLSASQIGNIQVATISRGRDIQRAMVTAWFASKPSVRTILQWDLPTDQRIECRLPLPATEALPEHDVLHVTLRDAQGVELWQKTIETMVVRNPPRLPAFGVTEIKLRYDPPISILAKDGTLSSMDYEKGWNPKFEDVVVSLPNGSRFVFWRGASYIPFWAGRYNTGLCYEWAETQPPSEEFSDCVEPLMDKELRYSRVEVLESGPARAHVRWNYQSCDFNYKVWGDSAVEDFYFYPDGMGTRVLSLLSSPGKEYEVSEFIVLTPQEAYPLECLAPNLVDALFLDGQKREFHFPFLEGPDSDLLKPRNTPPLYRIRLNKKEALAGIYFSPTDNNLPIPYAPFYDQGVLVTPAYWGSHWPLARGKTTGGSIDDRIHLTTAHNSLMTWGFDKHPAPLNDDMIDSIDTLGKKRPMRRRTWAWLIGMTDASDEQLIDWAQSFAQPASLEVEGGRFVGYAPERRAHSIKVESSLVRIEIKPAACCLNPVFELEGTAGALSGVVLGGQPLETDRYAWDGRVLWLDARIKESALLEIRFASRTKGK
jgi:hypothetical protein